MLMVIFKTLCWIQNIIVWYQKYFVFCIRNILCFVSEIFCALNQKCFVFGIRNDVIFESEMTSSLTSSPHVCVQFAFILR